MVLLTMIGRLTDGLPLVASFPTAEQEELSRNMTTYQNQAKQIFRKITPSSPQRCSIESGPYIFHYLIHNDACYLVLCDRNFPKRTAFAYLEDISHQFDEQYGSRILTASRPYAFIEFDTYLQRAKRDLNEGRAKKNLNQLSSELQDVQRIMVQNIDDVLQRGEALGDLNAKAMGLSTMSEKYRKDARQLNLSASAMKIAAVMGIIFILIILARFLWW